MPFARVASKFCSVYRNRRDISLHLEKDSVHGQELMSDLFLLTQFARMGTIFSASH
jgi:hypothetical protein